MPEDKERIDLDQLSDEQLIDVYTNTIPGDLINRRVLSSVMGSQYGGDRNIYDALGYPRDEKLDFSDYYGKYKRLDIAKAVIDKPVNATWRGGVKIKEFGEEQKETDFEQAYEQLNKKLNLKGWFSRLDKLTGLGHFGILLLGFNDVQKDEDFKKPVKTDNVKLLYVKAFGENSVEIDEWEGDPTNPRYSMPKYYDITVYGPEETSQEIKVHHSRIIHVVDGALQSDTYGQPRLEPLYNRLMDLEKLVGGDAEMFWRGARPGYAGKEAEGYELTPKQREEMQKELREYEHNQRRFIVTKGLELQSLQQQVADPSGHVDVQIQMISAETGIPKRILVGSERGELASTEDRTQWLSEIKTRREEFAEEKIIRPFVDACLKYGVLPAPNSGEYNVVWEDLFAPSNKEKAEIGSTRAEALYNWTRNPLGPELIPRRVGLKYLFGLPDDQVDEIEQMMEDAEDEEFKHTGGTDAEQEGRATPKSEEYRNNTE
ncbi:MAG: anti-CBASS protein Acb1 family protein [Bacteroidales bacterium]